MKEEENIIEYKHEEEVHIMCESEQGVYLDKEKEDADTEFANKLMNRERSSYQYTGENKDVDEKSIADFKYFVHKFVNME